MSRANGTYFIIHPPGKFPTVFSSQPKHTKDYLRVITVNEHQKIVEVLKQELYLLRAKVELWEAGKL